MPLGILDNADFDASVQSYNVNKGGHLVFCSDGLLEQENKQKEDFGMSRLKTILSNNSPENFIQAIDNEFGDFIADQIQTDDVSICHVDINNMFKMSNIKCVGGEDKQGQVYLNLDIQGMQLENFDVMQCLETFMKQTHMPLELRQKSFTVCAELIANAIEHGILGLESSIKEDENGFLKFLELREVGMQNLSTKDTLKLAMIFDSQKSEVSFRVSDSGSGYDPSSVDKNTQSALSGRGISLIERLSSKIHYAKDKNQTSVIIK
jgi:anti-sigma regulatory factor (Ser/Thr protein kinase)